MSKSRAVRCAKLILLIFGSLYVLWYALVQLHNFTCEVPEYGLVPLATNDALYARIAKFSKARADAALVEGRIESSSGKLSLAQEREFKWLIAKRFPVLPRQITRFTVHSSNWVEVSVRRVPWGANSRFWAGTNSQGWFLYLGDGFPEP